MDKIYADLIINGKKRYSEVPDKIKLNVKNILTEYFEHGELTAEELKNILSL